MTDHCTFRAYVFVVIKYLAVCDDNLKIDCEHILLLFSLKSGVCCFCPIEKPIELSDLKFTCDGQSKIESEVCATAS